MSEKRTSGGGAKTYVFEVGPVEIFDFSPAEIHSKELTLRRDMDNLLRRYMNIGPRSKVVRSEIREA